MRQFLCLLILNLGTKAVLASASSLNESGPEFRISKEYIFKIEKNEQKRIFNPNFMYLVKKIDTKEIERSISMLELLSKRFDKICAQLRRNEHKEFLTPGFEVISGNFNISGAKSECIRRGKNLIELQTTAHLLSLIQDMKLRKIETPANLKFSEKIKNFAFISNGNAFTNGVIKESVHGYPLNFKFDSFFYKN